MSKWTCTLSTAEQEEIYSEIKRSFSDFHLFDSLCGEKLRTAITEANNIDINTLTTKKVVERYFDVSIFKKHEQKLILAQLNIIFKAAYVLIISKSAYAKALFWPDVETLLQEFPEFREQEPSELTLLLNFRNMLRVTLLIIPAKLNKSIILKIAGRLEGSQNEYITGGGQKKEVDRRVRIYEKEGGIFPEKRPQRQKRSDDASSNSSGHGADLGSASSKSAGVKRIGAFSEKKLKQVRLESDEVRNLARAPVNPFEPSHILGGPAPDLSSMGFGGASVAGTDAAGMGAQASMRMGAQLSDSAVEQLFRYSHHQAFPPTEGPSNSFTATAAPGSSSINMEVGSSSYNGGSINNGCKLTALSSAAASLAHVDVPNVPTAAAEQAFAAAFAAKSSSIPIAVAATVAADTGIYDNMPPPELPSAIARDWSLRNISLPSLSREPSDANAMGDKYISGTEFFSAGLQDMKMPSSIARNISMSVVDGDFMNDAKGIASNFNIG